MLKGREAFLRLSIAPLCHSEEQSDAEIRTLLAVNL